MTLGDVPSFQKIGRRAIEHSPNNPELLADFGGKLAIDVGDWEEGLRLVRHALRLNPSPAPWYFLSLSYRALIDKDYRAAIRWSDEMNDPSFFSYHLIRAISFAALKDRAAVEKELNDLAALGTPNFEVAKVNIDNWSTHETLKLLLLSKLRRAYDFADGSP